MMRTPALSRTWHRSKKGRGMRKYNQDGVDVCYHCSNQKRHKTYCSYKDYDDETGELMTRGGVQKVPESAPSAEGSAPRPAAAAEAARTPDGPAPLSPLNVNESEVLHSDFLMRSWKEHEPTLPRLYGLYPTKVLNRRQWPSWKYTLPDPSLAIGSLPDPDVFLYGGCDVYVWCPFTFFPHIIDVKKLACPACGSNDICADGWSSGFMPIVSLGGKWPLLRVRRLRHSNCDKAVKSDSTCFSSLDETLLASWYPAVLLSLLPFTKSGKSFVSLDVVTYAREMQQLASYDAASDLHSVLREMWLQRRQKALLELAALERRRLGAYSFLRLPVQLKTLLYGKYVRGLSGKVLRDLGVSEVQRLHGYLEYAIASCSGRILKIDHTFYTAKAAKDADGTKPFTSLFTVMNETGAVLAFYFCETKSIKEIEPELQKLAERLALKGKVEVIYTDNPGADEAILKKLFGADVEVKKDIWHTLDKYYKALYKHPLRSWFMGELSNCFFSNDEKDVEEALRELRSSCPQYIDEDPPQSLLNGKIRRYIKDPEVIKARLEELVERYSVINGLFKKNLKSETHANALKDLDAGFLHDPEECAMYYNIGTDEKPRYVTVRSTSQLENLHRVLRSCIHGARLSLETMHCIIMDRIFRWNLMKHKRHTKYDGPRLLDPHLMMQVTALLHELPATCRPLWTDSVPTMKQNTGDETFGVLREEAASAPLHATRVGNIVSDGKSFVSRRTRIPEAARAVKSASELLMFKYYLPRCYASDDDYATPADNWNRDLVSWWLDGKDEVELAPGVIIVVKDVALKRAIHLEQHAKLWIAGQEANEACGADRDAQEAFKAARTKALHATDTTATRPIEHRADEPVGEYVQVLNEVAPVHAPKADSHSVPQGKLKEPQENRPKKTKTQHPCPHCQLSNRMHRKAGSDACELFQFYKRGNYRDSPGMSAFEKAIRDFGKIQHPTAVLI